MRNLAPQLIQTLQNNNIDTVYITGIATDFCVSWTATDAADLGYTSYVVMDATAPISLPAGNGTTVDVAMAEWARKNVTVLTMQDLMDTSHSFVWLIYPRKFCS